MSETTWMRGSRLHTYWKVLAAGAALATTGASAMTPSEEAFFRCRFPYPPPSIQRPSIPVAKYTNEHEGVYEEWVFEPNGQSVFGQPVSFLSYAVSRDEEYANDSHHISVVMPSASWDEIRWTVEQDKFRCSIHPIVPTEYSCASTAKGDGRSIMVAKANGANNRGDLSKGIVFTCSFDLMGKHRIPKR